MTIHLSNLIFSGVHGLTDKERATPQRFSVTIRAALSSSENISDDLERTVDYREIKKIIQRIIEQESHLLLETIACNIADTTLTLCGIQNIEVSVTKLDIWDNGRPGISVWRERTESFGLLPLDHRHIIDHLILYGGVSIPLLPVERRHMLLEEAERMPYTPQPESPESPLVREQLSSCYEFAPESQFHQLKDDIGSALHSAFPVDVCSRAFPTPLAFNELSLQLYEKGSIGITPHRDGKSRINIICNVILKGNGKLALCDDRSGSNPVYFDTSPGRAIILRGPGFMGSSYQPFHFLTDITSDRIVFGLRQKATS